MNADMNTVRLLGVAQVMIIVTFFIMEALQASAVGSGSISDILVNISKKLNLMRISSLAALAQTLVIISLGVLYYVVFYKEYKIIALVALGCFLVAAVATVVSKIGANALIPVSQEFVEAGAPEPSYLQTLGDFLYNSVDRRGIEYKRWVISYIIALIDGESNYMVFSHSWAFCWRITCYLYQGLFHAQYPSLAS
jgi:hypothetical protein